MSLSLERLAYCSEAVQPDMALIMLADIIAVSDQNNRRDGLTGALLVSRGRFFQVLEGPTYALDRAFARIEADPRHRNLDVVFRGPATDRDFAGWNLVAARIAPRLQPAIDAIIDDCRRHPAAAMSALRSLVDDQLAGVVE
jgi:hypothetical protein